MKRFFVTGTDTEIGKTFVTCGLLVALRDRGINAVPMKPIAAGTIEQDGVSANEDVHALIATYGKPLGTSLVNPYCFREPIAPHIAATHEHRVVDFAAIRTAYSALSRSHDTVLVEGAGGFLVPLSATESMSILPARLELEVILVVGMRLGCLNHALLTAEAIAARSLRLVGWVANTVDSNMSYFAENVTTLTALLPAPCLGIVPRLTPSELTASAKLAATFLDIEPLLD
jgi:dethiobiotin synthetase